MWGCKESLWASLSEPNFSYHSIVYKRSFIFTFWASLVHCVPPFASYQWSTSSRKKMSDQILYKVTHCAGCVLANSSCTCVTWRWGLISHARKAVKWQALILKQLATNFLKEASLHALMWVNRPGECVESEERTALWLYELLDCRAKLKHYSSFDNGDICT